LTDKGIGEVQNVAVFLRPLKLAVDAIWHSDKARAQQTGELLAGAAWARDGLVQREGLGPKDQVAATKEALEQTGGDLMIVGHLPFLGKLVALLVTGSEKNEIVEFRFGGVVCVEGARTRRWWWGKVDARPRKSEATMTIHSQAKNKRQVNIHPGMAIRALPLAISLTTGVYIPMLH
jgi:phosphohistidine phosphatase